MNQTSTEFVVPQQKKRIETYDIARGIGILLMVMGHTGFGMDFSKIIHSFHMPLFFFVSGFFYRPQKYDGFWEYLTHEAKVLLVPYLIFAVFYEFLHYLFAGEWSLGYFLLSLVSSNHNRIDVAGALWFLLCLFSAKILYHALTLSIKKIRFRTIIIVFVSITSSNLRNLGVMLPLALDSAMSCLLLIHVGYLLYLNKDKVWARRLFNLPWWLFVAIFVLFFVTAYYNAPVNIRRNRYGILPMYLISCYSGILLTFNLSSILEKGQNAVFRIIRRTMSYWGKESLVFLVLNELYIYIVSLVLSTTGIIVSENYWLQGLRVLITMALLTITAYCIAHTKLRYLFGKW